MPGLRDAILRPRQAPGDLPALQGARSSRSARPAEPARRGRAPSRRPARRRPTPRWSPEQAGALDKVGQWLKAGDSPVFRLFGFAGVGKTTLARHVAEHAAGKAAFAAYTGKAALVMRASGCAGATTIHSLIYTASEDNDGRPSFSLNEDGPASRAALIVIDECSMVDDELGRDLLSFGKPILVLGDPAQLPPVKGAGFFTESEPDVMLTEIHRQARDNPIIRLSQTIREGGEVAYGDYGEAQVIRRDEIDAEQVMAADQVLVGLNKTRRAYNLRIRAAARPRGADAGRRRQARLPAQRPREGAAQRRPVAGRRGARHAQRLRPAGAAPGGRSRPRAARRRRAQGVLRGRRGRPALPDPPRVRRVRLRLCADRAQGAGLAMGRRRAVRREPRLPRAPRALALHRRHARGASG